MTQDTPSLPDADFIAWIDPGTKQVLCASKNIRDGETWWRYGIYSYRPENLLNIIGSAPIGVLELIEEPGSTQ